MSNAASADASPLISIICRTTGREELGQALDSVAAQQHAPLELVLVDASGKGLDTDADRCAPARLHKVEPGQALPRAEAANAGLQAASGDYLMFLDEDDWIAPDHVSGLLQGLAAHSGFQAAYANTRKTDASGKALATVFASDYDPVLLLRDNYIPIHAMLFARPLLDHGCQFDSQFAIYEDWDFWLQLHEHTDFLHVDQETAFYREGGDSATSVSDVRQRYDNSSLQGQTRSQLFDKWLPRFAGSRFNALLGQLDQAPLLAELNRQVEQEHAANLEHQQHIQKLLEELEQTVHQLNLARSEASNLRASLGQQIADLEAQLKAIYASGSWKLTRPYRALGRLLGKPANESDNSDNNN